MKKSLLLSSLAFLAAQAMMAEEPYVLPGYFITDISANGQYIVSSEYETLIIRDLTNGDEWKFVSDYDGYEYSAGNGNCVSNNGIVVGSQTSMMDGSYFKDGEWHEIFSCSGYAMTTLNGITPDGSRICGSVGSADIYSSMDGDVTMLVPMIINAEGDDFGDVIMLPYPETDFVGRAPQYVTALEISEDGHTVAGMVTDCSGYMVYPIIYKEDSDGNWTYTLPTADLLNPNNLELPPYPGDAPTPPNPLDFMTEAEQEAYQAAYDAWIESGYQLEYPKYEDYMDMDEAEAYNEAVEEYNAEAEIFNQALDEYFTVWEQIVEESTTFVFNSVPMSTDGTKVIASAEVAGASFWDPSINYPVIIDVVNNTYVEYKNDNVQLIGTTVTGDGYALANEPLNSGIPCAYILLPGAAEFVSLYDYYLENAPSVASWMNDNMRHDVEEYDWETGDFISTNYLITGIAYGSADLSTIVSAAQSVWESDEVVYSYVFPQMSTGICGSVADLSKDINVTAQFGGLLNVTGEVASIQLFDLNGQLVFSAVAPAETVNTRLSSGVYVARATAADGSVKTFKLFF